MGLNAEASAAYSLDGAVFAALLPALAGGLGSRHRYPQDAVNQRNNKEEETGIAVRRPEEARYCKDGHYAAESHHINSEIDAQAAQDAAQLAAFEVAVQLLTGLFGLLPGGSRLAGGLFFGLQPLRTPENIYDFRDCLLRHDSFRGSLLQQQFRHPLFYPFHYLAAAVESLQFAQICSGGGRGFGLHREGVSAHADCFYLFHCFRVSIARTISCQAASISASWARPLSVIQ